MERFDKRSKSSCVDLCDKFSSLRTKWEKEICFPVSNIETAEDISKIKSVLEESGVVFITDGVSEKSIKNAKLHLAEEMWHMFQHDLPAESFPGRKEKLQKNLEAWNAYRNAKTGFGNVSFGYVNPQFSEPEDTPFAELNGQKIFMTHNGTWANVNLELLVENPHTASVLLALTHVNGMVSVDGAKYASNPKPKPKSMSQQQLTVPHVDIYSGAIERVQALVVVEEKVKLGFVVGSHLLKEEMCDVLGNRKLMCENGYMTVDHKSLKNALKNGWLAAPSRSLVLWKSGVVHFEATSAKKGPTYVFQDWSDTPNNMRLRFAVGVHKPVNMTREQLEALVKMGDQRVVPDPNRGINSGTFLYPNIVNRKNTQYLVPRTISDEERKMMNDVIASKTKYDWEKVNAFKKHLMGVSQEIETLPISEKDKKLLQNTKKR